MKKIAIALTLFTLSLCFSACRKIKYEEGDKLPRRKFLETINGVWEIKHGYISIDEILIQKILYLFGILVLEVMLPYN
jgi:hypothetical protein